MWVTAKYPQLQGSRVHYGVTATAMLSTDQIQLCKLGGGQPEPSRKPPACGRAVPTHGPFLPSKGAGWCLGRAPNLGYEDMLYICKIH